MDLQIFQFIQEALERLDEMKIDLDIASREIEKFFETCLEGEHEGYINVVSRVKTPSSLKEKILRHDYYKKFKTTDRLYEELSDVIGVRLECRFIEDEGAVYEAIKQYFNMASQECEGYFYAPNNDKILLELGSIQPKSQKNGIQMYRIDAKYFYNNRYINFELQIKSLVNIFWGEIEHKIIYKNYNYIIADKFYTDIMQSIKNSLTTIDQQLLLISNQFDSVTNPTVTARQKQTEQLLSKTIYEVFAIRMKNDIGILVDFRKSCDTIVKYVFRDSLNHSHVEYTDVFFEISERLEAIRDKKLTFDQEIEFEREIMLEDSFSKIIGGHIKDIINDEFQWNLFFRILFCIEPENNVRDFEAFITFYKQRIESQLHVDKLQSVFSQDFIEKIVEQLMERIAVALVKVNSVEILYERFIQQIVITTNETIEIIAKNIVTYSEWRNNRELHMELLEVRLLALFDISIDSGEVFDLLEMIRQNPSDIPIHKSIVSYIDKL